MLDAAAAAVIEMVPQCAEETPGLGLPCCAEESPVVHRRWFRGANRSLEAGLPPDGRRRRKNRGHGRPVPWRLFLLFLASFFRVERSAGAC